MTVIDEVEPQAPVSLVIGGMTCGACAARIERDLNSLEGVAATVNFASERARVLLDGTTSVDDVIAEVEKAGFSAGFARDSALSIGTDEAEADRQVHSLGRRLVVALLFAMPLCDGSLAFSLVPEIRFAGWQWLLIVMSAPVVTWAAWPFYKAALRGLRHGTSTMDTLVSLGIVAATGWSIYAMFWRDTSSAPHSILYVITHQAGGAIYIDVAAGVTTFLLAGRYFEASSRRRTGNALRSLAALAAKFASVIEAGGTVRQIPIADLMVGDEFVVRPGETIATDGVVTSGESVVDRSLMTGESVPVDVSAGDDVVGGTVACGGSLIVRATHVGRDTQLAQMARLVEQAQNEKADVQRLADRISAVFVPSVIAAASATLAGWLIAGGSAEHAFNAALSVLIIACPCALGLATPTALLVASGRGAKLGIFFKGYQALEASKQVDTVLLDKTGTVTAGVMSVAGVVANVGYEADEILRFAAAVEQSSEHPVGVAISIEGRSRAGTLPPVEHFASFPGLGASGLVDFHRVTVGKPDLLDEPNFAALAGYRSDWESSGHTVVVVGVDGAIAGAIALSDTVRESAPVAVEQLQRLGLHCMLVTGDNEVTAASVAQAIGVSDYAAGMLPSDKVEMVRRLQADGRRVAMVGDGVNDGPALAASDLGVAMGSGTDVAINAADIFVVRDDLQVVATAIKLARSTLRTIRGNLVWAFAYNVVAIPLAACGLLNPLIAGAAMVLSSSFVVWNSSRIGRMSEVQPDNSLDVQLEALTNSGSKLATLTVPTPAARS
ncbi:MAG: heavy metal translocating P-type ATPase [Acidimicrobiales bacterium]